MARGKSRRKPSAKKGKTGKPFGKSKGPFKKNKSTNGRDIKHRDQYKRPHPDEENVKIPKRQKIEESSEESEAEVDPYKELLSTFTGADIKKKAAVDSESESQSDDDEVSDSSVETKGLSNEPNLNKGDRAENNESEYSDDDNDNVSDRGDKSERSESHVDNAATDSEAEVQSEDDEQVLDDEDDDVLDDGSELTDEEIDISNKNDAGSEDLSDEGDPFVSHISFDLSEEAVEFLNESKSCLTQEEVNWPTLGRLLVSIPPIPSSQQSSNGLVGKVTLEEPKKFAQAGKVPVRLSEVDFDLLHVKTQLHDRVSKANVSNLKDTSVSSLLTPLQLEIFTLMNNYQDLYFPESTLKVAEEVRLAYCLHVANHVVKTRNTVLHHNARLNKKNRSDVPDDFRDQGLVRPKVLILVPFREQARRVVEMLINLLLPDDSKGAVMNRKRFDEEFSGEELAMPKKNPRPEDYEATFAGNTDDTFRLGITVTKKCLKLYADFYSSDIIISSPLGMRMVVGAEGELERDYDFLASIEILVLDQADVFFMQNWDHLLHVWDHLHLQPRESHGTDFSRVRPWAVSGWARHYRQTILLSSTALPEFSALMNKRCHNYAGAIRVANPISSGTICHVVVQLPQVFQRLEASSIAKSLEARFDYLTRKVIPEHTDPLMAHTMIYVPSYFDYVRVRNYLRKQELSFVQICEYSKDSKVARARDMFYHSQVQFLLYSERFHFFRRARIKGIRHIIFYQPPTIPHFYSEMCNLMQEANQNPHGGSESNMTVTVLYSRYDALQLSAIVGSDRASRMLSSDRNVHMFMTGE